MLMTAQDKGPRKNSIEYHISKKEISSTRRLCKGNEKTIVYILSQCPKLAQMPFKSGDITQMFVIKWYIKDMGSTQLTSAFSISQKESPVGFPHTKRLPITLPLLLSFCNNKVLPLANQLGKNPLSKHSFSCNLTLSYKLLKFFHQNP